MNAGGVIVGCTVAGTGDPANFTVTLPASGAVEIVLVYEVLPTSSTYRFEAGTYTVRINIGVANANVQLDEVYLCHVSSCTNQGTMGSKTGIATALSATGAYDVTLHGNGVNNGIADKIWAMVGMKSTSGVAEAVRIDAAKALRVSGPVELYADVQPPHNECYVPMTNVLVGAF